MNLKEKIVALCEEQDITIRELERRAGLKERTIQHWDESDPGSKKLYSVAQVLNVPVEELLSVYNPDLERVAYIQKIKKQADEVTDLKVELQMLRDRPDLRVLLHSGYKTKPETVRKMSELFETMEEG